MTRKILEELLTEANIPNIAISRQNRHTRVKTAKRGFLERGGYGPNNDEVDKSCFIDFFFDDLERLNKYVIAIGKRPETTVLEYDEDGRICRESVSGGRLSEEHVTKISYYPNGVIRYIEKFEGRKKVMENFRDQQGKNIKHDEPSYSSLSYYHADGTQTSIFFNKDDFSVELSNFDKPLTVDPPHTDQTNLIHHYKLCFKLIKNEH